LHSIKQCSSHNLLLYSFELATYNINSGGKNCNVQGGNRVGEVYLEEEAAGAAPELEQLV